MASQKAHALALSVLDLEPDPRVAAAMLLEAGMITLAALQAGEPTVDGDAMLTELFPKMRAHFHQTVKEM